MLGEQSDPGLAMVERRGRRRRDGTVYSVWRARWRDDTGAERSKTFDRAADARAWEAQVRVMKRGGALAEFDAGTETLAEFVEEWWLVYAGPNLERSTLRTYAQLWNGARPPRPSAAAAADATDDRAFPCRARGCGCWQRGDPQDNDDGPGRAAARGRVGARPVRCGEADAQAGQEVPSGGAGDPSVGHRGHARSAARRRPTARRHAACRACVRVAAAGGA